MMDLNEFKNIIQNAIGERNCRLDLLSSKKDLPIALFGYGSKGKQILNQLGYIKDKVHVYDLNHLSLNRARLDGFNVIDKIEDLSEFQVILGSGQNQIEQKEMIFGNHIFYEEATYLYDLTHIQSPARQMSDLISQEIDRFYWLYEVLQDESKQNFIDVLKFRSSLNPIYLQKTRASNKSMWLDVPLQFKSRDYKNFLDVGAFDGDTIKSARESFAIERAHAIETNVDFFPKITEQAKDLSSGLAIYPYAAWSSNCMLSFLEDHNGMFSITESESGHVCAATLDSIVLEKVDLIKMDIEGSEKQALSGCKSLLSSTPDLLIAGYHKPLDLVEISDNLLKQNSQYKVYFNHYSDIYDDSILYFLT
jgi:FkbM family methyltransferase